MLRRPAVSLPRGRRLEMAARLLAAGAVLLEADLWPTMAAARAAGLVGSGAGSAAVLGRGPVPLERVLRGRHGSQERFIAACGEWARTVQKRLHLAPCEPAPGGWGLDRWLEPLLEQLGLPLPPSVAEALWGVAVRPLPVPSEGELNCWNVASPVFALRLGRELAGRARSEKVGAWCLPAGIEEGQTVPRPPVGARGVLVIAGMIGPDDMAAAGRWCAQPGCSAVVVGMLPPGWEDAPGPRPAGPEGGLLTCGGGRPSGAAGPGFASGGPDGSDRRALLTASARWRWNDPPQEVREEPDGVLDVLGLAWEGLPEPLVLTLAGCDREALKRLEASGAVIRTGNRWRRMEPRPLQADVRHREVAGILPPDDPRFALHLALAGEPGPLVGWLQERLDDLDGPGIQGVLRGVASGAAGRAVALLHAQGCLLEADVAGARHAVRGQEGPGAAAIAAWALVLDGGDAEPLPDGAEAQAPLAAAVAALLMWRRMVRFGRDPGPWPRLAKKAARALSGGPARLAALLRLAVEDPGAFRRREGRRLAGDHPYLRRVWLHRVAVQERDEGRLRAARRALRVLAADSAGTGSGWLGLVLLDLGAVELHLEDRAAADRANLAAMRRLEAAGLSGHARGAAFNLAVSDLDELRLENAMERFGRQTPGPGGDDPFLTVELARLELARGDLDACARRLAELDRARAPVAVREGFELLEGALALLSGRIEEARSHLERAGAEGRDWLELVTAVSGREGSGSSAPDGWGVRLAAELVRSAREGAIDVGLLPERCVPRREALALALAARLCPPGLAFPPGLVAAARGTLEAAGMAGWVPALVRRGGDGGTLGVEALEWVGEMGTLEGMPDRLSGALLALLGATGVEVRAGGTVLRIGEGAPGTPLELVGLRLVPLGAEDADGPAWRLLGRLLLPSGGCGVAGPPVLAGDETGLVGSSASMETVRRDLMELAPTRLAVLVQGETGTGKELAARALHRLSGRSGRFVALNVAAVPENLVESELFGSARGAFTGATARQGLVAAADGGTLFLDEIGELDPRLQAKLLRFLETREVRPVGSTQSRRIDVRVVSATHRDLEEMMAAGSFRRDLYYRLATVTVRIPPLRDRLEDIPELVEALASRLVLAGEVAPARWSPAALTRLRAHGWEGNVRELAHTVAVAMTRARGRVVRPEHLPLPEIRGPEPARRWSEALDELRRRLVLDALGRADGNRTRAARELGITRQTLLYHMDRLGIR